MHHISLPDIPTRIGERRGDPQPARRLLFDVKTIHAGGGSYYTRRAYDQQGGAVHERELQIWHEYQRHARELDTRFSPAGQHPILELLQSHGRTRGLVYGAYGEGSADVHALIAKAAEARAAILWREAGARTETEMRAFLIGQMRRRVGVAAVQAMARHRIARVPYVGASHAVVQATQDQRRLRQRGGQGAWVHEAQDVQAMQGLAVWQVGGAAAAWAA